MGFSIAAMRSVRVPLGARSYEIRIDRGLLASLGRRCRALGLGQRCAVITDRRVGPRFAKAALRSLGAAGFDAVLVTVPAGEKAKSLAVVARSHEGKG